MEFHGLADRYRAMNDDELVQLADQRSTLTPEAWVALSAELGIRRIVFRPVATTSVYDVQAGNTVDSPAENSSIHPNAAEFISEVLRFYHRNRWTFIELIFPAVVVGTVAVIWGRHESHEISQHLYRRGGIVGPQMGLIKIAIATWGSYLLSWIAFCFAFGMICAATEHVRSGFGASIPASFSVVRDRLGPILRLSLILWLVLVTLVAIAMLCIVTILSATEPHSGRTRGLGIYVLSLALFGLAALILSRFSLAMPALVLDGYSIKRAMCRSYELTRGNWPILATLLFKSIAAGYVAGMLPFWLARWIPANADLPTSFSWILTAASIAAVTVIEPIIFIGFALLYLKTSQLSGLKSAQANAI